MFLASFTVVSSASPPPSSGCPIKLLLRREPLLGRSVDVPCHANLGCAGVPPRRSRRATAELRAAPSLEALMQLLVARAKLLLSLRSVVQAQRQEQVPPPVSTLATCSQ
jgi:hypothetical protein